MPARPVGKQSPLAMRGVLGVWDVRPALFTDPASAPNLERAAEALTKHGFTVEILDGVADARVRVKGRGLTPWTAPRSARRSGRRCRPPTWSCVVVGSVAAVTETGSLVVGSASGSQLPGYAGAAARAIWVVGAQKVVPDLGAALRRVEEHCLPLESERAKKVYGVPSALNRVLILRGEHESGRGIVLLLRETIGF